MKKLFLLFLIISCFLLTSCKKEEDVTPKAETPHILENQLGFVYQGIKIVNNNILIEGFLTNGYEKDVYPISLYIKVYNENVIYAEDTLVFTDNYFITKKTVNKVTIIIPLNEDVVKIEQYEIFYEYDIDEKPITLEL